MKVATFILAGAIALTGCTTMDHYQRSGGEAFGSTAKIGKKDVRATARILSPELARELRGKDEQRIAFAIAIDNHNRMSLIRPDSSVNILTPKAKEELSKMGLKNTRYVLTAYEGGNQQFLMSDEDCWCPPYTLIDVGVGGRQCMDIGYCPEEGTQDDVFW